MSSWRRIISKKKLHFIVIRFYHIHVLTPSRVFSCCYLLFSLAIILSSLRHGGDFIWAVTWIFFWLQKSAKVMKLSEKLFLISFTHSSRSNCKKDFLSFSSSSTQKKAIIKINGSLILLSMPHSHFHSHAEHYYYTKGKKRRKKTFKKHYTHSWRWWW